MNINISKIKITEITRETLRDADKREVLSLHRRIHQLWGTLENVKDPDKKKQLRTLLMNKHVLVAQEMMRRRLEHNIVTDLDAIILQDGLRTPFEEVKEEEIFNDFNIDKMRAPFELSGGKSNLAKKIVRKIPSHEIYVEPFCGAASVFFGKIPSKKEILADIDRDIVEILSLLKSLTDSEIKQLEDMDWQASKSTYEKLQGEGNS